MSLETFIAGSEDRLVDGLHFGSRNTASYVTARRAATFHPTSASAWKPSGVRLMRFNLADVAGWLDGGTMRLIMSVNNTSPNHTLSPLCDSPASMLRRVRVIANGSAILEDIEEYGRVYQMFSEMLPAQRRYNNISESWGATNNASSMNVPFVADAIPADSSRQVVVTLLSSFLSQGKMIPLSMLPITIELELDDADAAFSGSGNSWEITRPRLVADVCDLDQALANSYAKHILDGKSLPFYMHGLYSLRAAVPAGSSLFSLPIARGFTRLSTVYITLWNGATGKWVNSFTHPNAGDQNIEVEDTTQWNITLGAERWPTFNCESTQESFYRLRLAQQAHQGSDSFGISSYDYRNTKFIIGQSFEKAPGGGAHTGINTRSGAQLTLNFRNLGATTLIHVVLHYEQIVNVSAAGAEVLD